MKEVTILSGGFDDEGETILRVYLNKEVAEQSFNKIMERQKTGEWMPYDYYVLETFKVI